MVTEKVEKSVHLLTIAGVATRLGQRDIERRPWYQSAEVRVTQRKLDHGGPLQQELGPWVGQRPDVDASEAERRREIPWYPPLSPDLESPAKASH